MWSLTERGFSNPRFILLAGKKNRPPFLVDKTAATLLDRRLLTPEFWLLLKILLALILINVLIAIIIILYRYYNTKGNRQKLAYGARQANFQRFPKKKAFPLRGEGLFR